MANLPPELEVERKKILEISKRLGLDCFETIFEVVPYKMISEIAAYGGFPIRYPHWRFGMEYEKLSKSYEYGLSKIYEMVINTDPCYAYLMQENNFLDQKLVMAHVYGHCDFFKNNVWFSKTNRKMLDTMANHSIRIQRYIERYGYERVEKFIDNCLSLENLIDRYSVYDSPSINKKETEKKTPNFHLNVQRDYMEKFVNPPEYIERKKQEFLETQKNIKFPEKPEKDVLNFLMNYAPLEDWEQDIVSIIRNEAYYFSPQGMTKTLNEGWASYWHSKILTEEKILNDSEIIDFADKHAGVLSMTSGNYNPYKVGIELLKDIENRWDTGKFGREWENCDDIKEKINWNKRTNMGREKIFEVRKLYNDVSFISEFLTEDFCVKNKMFVYKFDQETRKFVVDTTNFKAIKNQLLFYMTNFGQPIISIENSNHDNKGELLLSHLHEGMDLQPQFMEATMKSLFEIWKRPILMHTTMQEAETIFRYDGQEFKANPVKKD